MIRSTAQPVCLLFRQIRVLNASKGLRIQAVSGRLWITQPNATQDLFLLAGDSVMLRQDRVVVEADVGPASGCSYVLSPLVDEELCCAKPLSLSVGWRGLVQRITGLFNRMGANASPV